MGKVFTAFVHVADDKGASQVFSPGDAMPEWAEAHVHNPKVWSDDGKSPAPSAGGDGPVEPPRSGPGSGKAVWADYAKDCSVDVAADASREDIIAAVDAAREG